ncbi:S41 family peptidase [Chryseobacterium sp. G0201]|uniref:S41 family peptidase n=1 Tax=Chryseobacterium sp. G0201 TaxID=2487065 RepID=UPI000F4D6013|nr:S41 family peptidase [Chryseobacterium sp. G0201]AZA54536.1 hypothetical protein EG348_16825 [Chryseobacterium sp. G0201]
MRFCFKICILFALVTNSISLKAQNCRCADNFNFVVDRIKKNYPGYHDKVNTNNKIKFDKFTDSLLKKAFLAKPYQCAPILRSWLSFFKDNHIGISYNDGKYTDSEIRNYYDAEEKTTWSEPLFISYLKGHESLDSLEGIWNNYAGTYQIGIVKDKASKNDFIGFIIKPDGIRWSKQQVKLRIEKKGSMYSLKYFRASDHSINPLSFSKIKDTLSFGTGLSAKWYKNDVTITQVTASQNKESAPQFTALDDKTCLFTMPSFASLDYVSAMNDLLKENSDRLQRCEHLIIDLRNNSGGSVLVYKKLLPYIYTNPILTEGANVLATQDNIQDYYSQIPNNIPDSMKRIFEKNLNTLKLHVGTLYPLYPIDTITLPKVFNNPKSVSLIVNRNTSSAAELFIMEAKQSSKVKVYGTNSSGTIDYLEVVKANIPCGFYNLNYPAARSLRLPDHPMDNIGIKPDILIPQQTGDWIEFVKTYKDK